jgi:cellulose synthase operon protein YhjU
MAPGVSATKHAAELLPLDDDAAGEHDVPAGVVAAVAAERSARTEMRLAATAQSGAVQARGDRPARALPTLGWWNVYFLGKLALYWQSVTGLHPLENLAFALALLVPIGARWLRRLRTIVAVPVAVALAYYDSWLPPFERLTAQASNLAAFTLPYLVELAGRFVSWPIVLMLVIVLAAYASVARRLRVGVGVLAMLVALSVADRLPQRTAPLVATASAGNAAAAAAAANAETDLDTLLDEHFRNEATRQVRFNRPPADAVPFDLIFLHVCSLSWDDLRATGLDHHPLFARFDILLTRFNSASTYSGPAAIRLLRAPCGQQRHEAMYSQVQEQCYLVPQLRQAGFDVSLVMNHDGVFDDMLGTIRRQRAQDLPLMPVEGLPIAQRAFDGSPVQDDLAVLDHWLDSTKSGSAQRVAAIYNTASLHDGNQLADSQTRQSSRDTYGLRLKRLLDELERLIGQIEQSDRRVVIALIPEHGAALRGDRMQISGLREIPTPAITLVPVAVMVIGHDAHRNGPQVQIDAPTSHLALAHIVSRMLERSPFGHPEFRAQDYVADLPTTDYVAENASMLMMQRGDRYYLHMPNAGWSEYSTTADAGAGGPR